MGRILYAAMLLCLLVAWALGAAANVTLPVYSNSPIGCAFVALAAILIASGLWRGSQSYWIVPYPIHSGIVALSIGVSMIAQSASGLWLITPVVAIGCVAVALASKSETGETPRLLPPDDDQRPTTLDGIRFLFIVVIPWLAIFEFTSHMRLPGTAFRFPFEDHLPVYAWTAIVYETSYLTVTFAPAWTRTNRQLRQLIITSWVAIAIVYPIYWLLPSAAPRRPMIDNSWIAHLLTRERTGVAPSAAFPSFHVLWAIFVGRLWPRWLWISYSVLIAISCITTGMHYIPDVLAAFAISPLLLEPGRRMWNPLTTLVNRTTKSRHDGRWIYAAIASVATVAVVSAALEPASQWHGFVTALAGFAGIALGARRGHAFVGGWIGVLLACPPFEDRWILFGAFCLCAPLIQAIERPRLPRLLANLFLSLVLLRLWNSGGCPLSVICGVYAIGAGLILFVEKRRYIGAGAAIIGAGLTTLASPGPPALAFSRAGLLAGVVLAFIAGWAAAAASPAKGVSVAAPGNAP